MAGRQRRPICPHLTMHRQHEAPPSPIGEEHIFLNNNLNCMKRRKNHRFTQTVTAGALVLGAVASAHAQYSPPPPPALFPGFINEALRQNDRNMNEWDLG